MELFDKRLLEKIGRKLMKKRQTVAVAESVTSGLLQFSLSCIPEAAKFYHGGLTAYNIGQKFKHLQVEPLHALSVNCVSPNVAREMALNVCSLYSSHWGIGITGYSSAVPESRNKVFAYYAIAYKGKVKTAGKINPLKVEPTDLQRYYVERLLTAFNSQI